MKRIAYSAIKTPDGTILESLNTHDYKSHLDAVSGEVYMLDGGLSYCRRSVNTVPAEDLSVYVEDGIAQCREVISWGTFGKDGTSAYRRVLLKDMTNEHIANCLVTQRMHPTYVELFTAELDFRKQHGIKIVD